MKKLFTLLFVLGFIGIAQAQVPCDTATISLAAPGLTPADYNDLPCIERNNTPYDELIFLLNFDSVDAPGLGTVRVHRIRIDSINNIPCGIGWAANQSDHVYYNQQKGCLRMSGATDDPAGSYELGIHIAVDFGAGWFGGGNGSPFPSTALGLRYFVRVVEPGATCPNADTVTTLTSSCHVTSVGIEDIQGLETTMDIVPNPMNQSGDVIFTSAKAANFTGRVLNLIGKEIHQEAIAAVPGFNRVKIDTKALSPGVYFYAISDGNETVTKRFVVSH